MRRLIDGEWLRNCFRLHSLNGRTFGRHNFLLFFPLVDCKTCIDIDIKSSRECYSIWFCYRKRFFLSLHPIGMLFARKVDDGIMDGNIDIDTQYVRISSLPYRHCRCDELKIAIDKFTFFVDSISRVEL